jgi:hypothetical protein
MDRTGRSRRRGLTLSNIKGRIHRGLALATVAGALAAPAASAAPIDSQGTGGSPATSGQPTDSDASFYADPVTPNAALGADGVVEPTLVAISPADGPEGFDWGDAGIGAAAMLAVGAIGAGAALATGRMPRRRDVPQSAS